MPQAALRFHSVVDVRPRGERVFETYFEAPELAAAVTPGQFVMLRRPESLDPLLPRPMSVYRVERVAGVDCVSVLYTVMGVGTARLAAMRVGDSVSILGPLGNGFSVAPEPSRALLVAGGIGIAGLALLAADLHRRGVPQTLTYGARSAADLVMVEEFEALGCDVMIATDDGSRGRKGVVTMPLEELARADGFEGARAYACGPTPMLRAVRQLALNYGLDTELALEARMACGFGICLGCSVPSAREPASFQLVCKDGPVFQAADVVP